MQFLACRNYAFTAENEYIEAHFAGEIYASYYCRSFDPDRSRTPRGIRKILARYSERASLERNLSPHMFRHFFLSWLKRQGINDALIQPYSGHESRKSLEIYSKLTITDEQHTYDDIIKRYPI